MRQYLLDTNICIYLTNALVRNTKVIQLSYILKQKSGRKNVLSAGIANGRVNQRVQHYEISLE